MPVVARQVRTGMIAAAVLTATGCAGGATSTGTAEPSAVRSPAATAPASSAPVSSAPASPTPGRASATIPAPYLGSYAGTAERCGTPHELRLTLAAGRVDFWESTGVVTSAVVDADLLTVTGTFTGEGSTRTATYRFRLSPDGATLTDADGGVVRVRCP